MFIAFINPYNFTKSKSPIIQVVGKQRKGRFGAVIGNLVVLVVDKLEEPQLKLLEITKGNRKCDHAPLRLVFFNTSFS